jgi:hypothetical protein
MPEESNHLIDLETERAALHGVRLQGVLARISADVIKQTSEANNKGERAPVIAIRPCDIDVKTNENTWLEHASFPITPLEAWYLLRGYLVKTKRDIAPEIYALLPVELKTLDGYVMLAKSTKKE